MFQSVQFSLLLACVFPDLAHITPLPLAFTLHPCVPTHVPLPSHSLTEVPGVPISPWASPALSALCSDQRFGLPYACCSHSPHVSLILFAFPCTCRPQWYVLCSFSVYTRKEGNEVLFLLGLDIMVQVLVLF